MAGNRITNAEMEERVEDCFNLRYKHKYTHNQWQEHCKKMYNDKSEMQYTKYWMQAGERYTDGWKEKLNKLLEPATDELYNLLASDDAKIRQQAVNQIMKYTGNDISKIEADVKVEQINLNWGNDGETGI
jgi:hypothetical protein